VLGLSTHKMAKALLPILGRPVSQGTVGRAAKQLDAAIAAFYQWKQFLCDLIRCGPTGGRLEMLCVDGGCGPARRLAGGLPPRSRSSCPAVTARL
jgi:hypothetical protein